MAGEHSFLCGVGAAPPLPNTGEGAKPHSRRNNTAGFGKSKLDETSIPRYTALEAGQFCFCSTIAPNAVLVPISQCNSPCPGYAGDPLDLTCGSINDNILKQSEIFLPFLFSCVTQVVDLKNSTVTANSTTLDPYSDKCCGLSFGVCQFNIYGYDYNFDFGDGSPVTDWYTPSALPIQKYFYMPGTFQITVWVQSVSNPLVVESSTTISINSPAMEISSVNCPSMANISEMVTCWFTVNFTSYNVTIFVDFGDFTNATLQANSTQYFAVGKTPPLYGSSIERFQTSFPSGSEVFMKESEFQQTGTIYGFETVNTNGAQLVLQPLADGVANNRRPMVFWTADNR
uniref:PKD domain-containing protein n=1 Tax=Romanomermis culicivorax TaxID=13658 RepID=A0A915HKW9_ROMCU